MSPLTRKLGRDLIRIRGQAVAIGMVIAVGVLLLVMMTGLIASLTETRRAYYERYRLADIFVSVSRAPERVVADLRAIPGVAAVESRVAGSALIDLDGAVLPVQARVLSLPVGREPALNEIYLSDGRRLDAGRADEVIVLKSFAVARGLKPGDILRLTMNGFQRGFRIVGFARAPEFLYTTAPGELISEDGRFAVLWMSRKAMEAAFDMKGAFNEALLSLSRGAEPKAVMAAADRVLDRYGGLGAFGVEDLTSNRFISEEINGLKTSTKYIPPVFLAVAAYLIFIVISRMVEAERGEIGLMKAFGYTNGEVGWHYFQMILVIAIGGALVGCLLGIAAGRAMINVYLVFYKFPFLVFRLDPASFASGFLISIFAASAGGVAVLRKVFALTPAVAMRPAAPPDYSRAGQFGAGLKRLLDQPTRMVLRRVMRQPGRMLGAVTGLAAGVALSAAMTSVLGSFDDVIDLSFGVIDRSDATVTFIHPLAARAALDLARLPGVIEVEPVRVVPAIMKNGRRTYRGAVHGLIRNPRLNRAVDRRQNPIALRADGIILSTGLAKKLGLGAGGVLTLDVREGRRPVVDIPVVAVADTLLGSPAYMEMDALNRVLGEPLRVSGAWLLVDPLRADGVYRALKNMPMVIGVGLKSNARAAFRKVMDQGAGAMRYIMALIAAIITFGVVYNAARVAQAERSRDLANLKVLGFSRAEVAYVLLGELGIVTLLALPLGGIMGYFLSFAISIGFSTDLYQIPARFGASSYGSAILIVTLSAIVSGWLVKRDIDRADLVTSLKSRE